MYTHETQFLPPISGTNDQLRTYLQEWADGSKPERLARNPAYAFGVRVYELLQNQEIITPVDFARSVNQYLDILKQDTDPTIDYVFKRVRGQDEEFYDRWRYFAADHIARRAFGDEFSNETMYIFEGLYADTIEIPAITDEVLPNNQ